MTDGHRDEAAFEAGADLARTEEVAGATDPPTDCPPDVVEVRRRDDGTLDEVVADNCFVHLEQLSESTWWLGISKAGFRQSVRFAAEPGAVTAEMDEWPASGSASVSTTPARASPAATPEQEVLRAYMQTTESRLREAMAALRLAKRVRDDAMKACLHAGYLPWLENSDG